MSGETYDRGGSRRPRPVLAAVGALGATLGWLLAAPMEAEFAASGAAELPYAPDAWAPAYHWLHEHIGEPLRLSTYYFWGKLAFLVYLAGLFVTRGLPTGACRRSVVGRRLLLIAWTVGLVGDVVAYWGGAGEEMTLATDIGFLALEVPAMLTLVVSLGVLGFGYRHDRMTPGWVPWLLVATAVLALPSTAVLIGYVPHGVLVTLLVGLTVAALAGPTVGDGRAVGVAGRGGEESGDPV